MLLPTASGTTAGEAAEAGTGTDPGSAVMLVMRGEIASAVMSTLEVEYGALIPI